MEERDYVLRLIAAVGRVLARALGLRGARKHDEAMQEVRAQAGQLFGLDIRLLELMDEASLKSLFTGGVLDPAQAAPLGDVLVELARNFAALGRAEAADRRQRAIWCYEVAANAGAITHQDRERRIAATAPAPTASPPSSAP